MKLPYVENPPQFDDQKDQEIVERVKQRRGERGLQPLDLTLLHSPPIADGWNSFLGAIRTRTTLSATVRELAVCRVAVLNKAWYEWMHHVPLLRAAGEIDEEGIQHILRAPPAGRRPTQHAADGAQDSGPGITAMAQENSVARQNATEIPAVQAMGTEPQRTGRLEERLLAVMAYTDAMTLDVRVDEATFGRLKEHFNDREVVEITGTVAAYNCVSRFLVAMDVGEQAGKAGPLGETE
ncbi:hypothetical protein K490DRAFT_65234 [Saccharata proteae CBS 121410]|uniref:Carboxymuconolactone decarboxylase-like domain-containing protein n=1 Tax=Saccharata proteae CBS 121410 TaxID=1314787 RepID=A0A9P4HTW3_9PEZI|nr:hypothetical protein K490DRAFT_65234 [Saccharata proteae CBS 121410]